LPQGGGKLLRPMCPGSTHDAGGGQRRDHFYFRVPLQRGFQVSTRIVHFLSLLFMALVLGPSLAHWLELPAKMGLDGSRGAP